MAYKLRIGGTNDFVSVIDPWDKGSYPPGRVDVVSGWDNPAAIIFDSLEAAHKAADKVAEYILYKRVDNVIYVIEKSDKAPVIEYLNNES